MKTTSFTTSSATKSSATKFISVAAGIIAAGLLLGTLTGAVQAAPVPLQSLASFSCGDDVTIRSRSLTNESAASICKRLNATRDEYFDVVLQETPLTNAAGNQTIGVDFYAFRTNADYVRFGNQLDISPSSEEDENNGVMFDYDPATPGNRALIAVNGHGRELTEADNIEHEFVHYLDYRYNQSAEQSAPLWWSEGIAQVIGNPQDLSDALRVAFKQRWKLSDLLWNESTDDQELTYGGGAAAVEFFLSTRPEELTELLSVLRNGSAADYEEWAEWIGTSLDREFAQWVRVQARSKQVP